MCGLVSDLLVVVKTQPNYEKPDVRQHVGLLCFQRQKSLKSTSPVYNDAIVTKGYPILIAGVIGRYCEHRGRFMRQIALF